MFIELFKALLAIKPLDKNFPGDLEDDRTEQAKAKDWQAEEVASSATMKPEFRKVRNNGWKKFTVRDQAESGSCVAQAIAKGFEVLYQREKGKTVVFSATPIYQQRRTKPDGGMFMTNAFAIAAKTGTCEEKYCASQFMSDEEMDRQKVPANFEELNDLIDATAYLSMPHDFDYVAAWIERFGYASIHIASDRRSWSLDFPRLGSTNRGIRHAVAGVDAVTYNGVQYIVIEDSWGEFGKFKGQRLLSREVFNDMFTRGAGFTVLKFDVKPIARKFAPFEAWMQYGERSAEITRFQDYLKTRGYFPSNVDSTGYYGSITALAVYNFQIASKAASPVVLNKYQGKFAHAGTLRQVNLNL